MGFCKWCETEQEKMAKAHILPKAFVMFDQLPPEKRYLVSKNDYKKKSPTGTWDNNILCRECEDKLSQIDSKAADILLKRLRQLREPALGELYDKAFFISAEHRNDIKKFLMFVLWRASASERPEFAGVSLGVYEDRIKKSIQEDNIQPHEYSFMVVISEIPTPKLYPLKLLRKDNAPNYYVICLADLTFFLKVDKQTTPPEYFEFEAGDKIVFFTQKLPPQGVLSAVMEDIEAHIEKYGEIK